jgi:hypothetical protein
MVTYSLEHFSVFFNPVYHHYLTPNAEFEINEPALEHIDSKIEQYNFYYGAAIGLNYKLSKN